MLLCLLLFAISSCLHISKHDNLPLLVSNVSTHTNTGNSEHINQIAFHFNQNIAIVGSIPSLAQIRAIQLPQQLSQLCRWRFANLKVLSCELREPLRPLTSYDITLTTKFTANGKALSQAYSHSIKTPLPQFSLRAFTNNTALPHFPNTFTFQHHADKLPRLNQQLVNALQLKHPSGEYTNVVTSITRQHKHLTQYKITLPLTQTDLRKGRYKLVIPKGFTAQSDTHGLAYTAFNSEHVVHEFMYYPSFEFVGFACNEVGGDKRYTRLVPELDGKHKALQCAPERIHLIFSRRLATTTDAPIWSPTWLSGPLAQSEQNRRYPQRHQNLYYYPISFDGNSAYKLNLPSIVAENGDNLLQNSAISFTTQASTDLWYLPNFAYNSYPHTRASTTIESNSSVLPYVLRRNASDLQVSMQAISSANALQTWLHADASLRNVTFSPFKPNAKNSNRVGPQNLNVRAALNNSSGLVSVKLQGKSEPTSSIMPTYSNESVENTSYKEAEFIANSAAYNVAVHHGGGFMVQTLSWHGKPLANTLVELVCSTTEAPIALGHTNAEGVLLVEHSKWLKVYSPLINTENEQNAECWLWTTAKDQDNNKLASSAILLDRPDKPLPTHNTMAFAYTAQPLYEAGDTVHIGVVAKQRQLSQTANSSKALLPLNGNQQAIKGDYSLVIKQANNSVVARMALGEFSQYGLNSASFKLSSNAAVGRYSIHLHQNSTNTTQAIGDISVTEFTPPEFEFTLELPQQTTANQHTVAKLQPGQALSAKIDAQRLNGEPLNNAQVNTQYRLNPAYKVPALWPQEYEYISYETYRQHQQKPSKEQTFLMDNKGHYTYISKPISATIPLAHLVFTSEVIADNGEAQQASDSIYYMAREHYIGTKLANNKLALIAVTQNGQALNHLPAKVQFFKQHTNLSSTSANSNNRWQVIGTCNLTRLPDTCSVPKLKSRMRVVITSGNDQYKWIRYVHYTPDPVNQPAIEYPALSLKVSDKNKINQYASGTSISLNASSNISGRATFVLHSGSIQKVWHQQIKAGDNPVSVELINDYIPHASISVSMPVSKDHLQTLENTSVGLTPSKNLRKIGISPPPNKALGAYRLLHSQIDFEVVSPDKKPEVLITPLVDSVEAGSKIKLKITANKGVETQLWLVNDGLLAMAGAQVEQYNPHDYFLYHSYLLYPTPYINALSQTLLTHDALQRDNQSVKRLAMHADIDSGESFGLSSPREPKNRASTFNKTDFAQSIWLSSLSLEANKATTIEVPLPQLIGRWKVIAISVDKHHSSVSQASFTTHKNVEYFLDAPSTLLDSDKSNVAITQINHTNHRVEDLISVFINGKMHTQIPVSLEPANSKQSYQRQTIGLPSLSVGDHEIMLKSTRDPKFSAYANVQILPSVQPHHQAILLSPTDEQTIRMPSYVIPNSIALSAIGADNLQPNWQRLNNYTREHHYRYWESVISRAVTHAYAPNSESDWTDSGKKLNSLLAQVATFKAGNLHYKQTAVSQADPFLTAYTFLVHAWLAQTATPLEIDETEHVQTLLSMLGEHPQHEYSALQQSMALFALAVNNSIELPEALLMRQHIPVANRVMMQSSLLQVLALQYLGASDSLYSDTLLELKQNTYVDSQSNMFSENAYKCFAIMAYENDTKLQSDLLQQVVLEQQQQGHFGNSFANAICTYVISSLNSKDSRYEAPQLVNHSLQLNQLRFSLSTDKPYWLHLSYLVDVNDLQAVQNGMSVSKQLFVKRTGKWQKISHPTLEIGDLVKTTVTVNSPVARQHIVITDGIAGGFEALPNGLRGFNHSNKAAFGRDYLPSRHRPTIENGHATWLVSYLPAGNSEYSYYSRVKHIGQYTITPSEAVAMYRGDVNARGKVTSVDVITRDNK